MRVLVTGGNRFVGLQLVRKLHTAGHDVTVVNSHAVPYPEGVRRVHARREEEAAYSAALDGIEVDAVFDNTAYSPADVQPLLRRFAGRVQQYLFTSSIAVYRRSDLQPTSTNSSLSSPIHRSTCVERMAPARRWRSDCCSSCTAAKDYR